MQQQRTGHPDPAVPGHLTAGDLHRHLYVALWAVARAAVLAPLVAPISFCTAKGDVLAGLVEVVWFMSGGVSSE
jgi:hypothetical protein